MTMTVLPSFRTFLQNSATAQPPSSLLLHQKSPNCTSYGWHLCSNASGMQTSYYTDTNSSISSAEMKSEDEASSHRAGFKRPLIGPDIGPLSPSTTCSSVGKRVKKKYLKERERCEIMRRVHAGEKQSHLAKEFGVTRAAVCYLLKHQTATMRRLSQRHLLPDGTYASC